MLCPACGTWSTQADRCSHCGAVPAAPPPAPVPAGGVPGSQPPAAPGAFGQQGPGAYPHNPYLPQNPYVAQVPAQGGQMPYGAYAAPAQPGYYGVATPVYGWRPQAPFRSLKGLAVALYVLLAASAVGAVVSLVAYLMRALLLGDLIDDPSSVTDGEADNADTFVTVATGFAGLALFATAIVFCVWFYRARCNVDLFGPSKQTLARGWAIGGWFCPVVWWWFPMQIADDVWKASDPDAADRGGATPGRKGLLWTWWILFVLAVWSHAGASFLYPSEDDIVLDDAKDLRTADYVTGGLWILMVLAAIAAILVVRRITAFQHTREARALAAAGLPHDPAAAGWSGAPMTGPAPVPSADLAQPGVVPGPAAPAPAGAAPGMAPGAAHAPAGAPAAPAPAAGPVAPVPAASPAAPAPAAAPPAAPVAAAAPPAAPAAPPAAPPAPPAVPRTPPSVTPQAPEAEPAAFAAAAPPAETPAPAAATPSLRKSPESQPAPAAEAISEPTAATDEPAAAVSLGRFDDEDDAAQAEPTTADADGAVPATETRAAEAAATEAPEADRTESPRASAVDEAAAEAVTTFAPAIALEPEPFADLSAPAAPPATEAAEPAAHATPTEEAAPSPAPPADATPTEVIPSAPAAEPTEIPAPAAPTEVASPAPDATPTEVAPVATPPEAAAAAPTEIAAPSPASPADAAPTEVIPADSAAEPTEVAPAAAPTEVTPAAAPTEVLPGAAPTEVAAHRGDAAERADAAPEIPESEAGTMILPIDSPAPPRD